MQLPRLQLTNTMAMLGLEQTSSKITIRQPLPDVKMRQPNAEVQIQKSKGHLEIDQTEAFADANLKHAFASIKDWTAKAKQKVLQNISKEVSEGKRLMKIEDTKESVIPQIAKEKSEPPPKVLNIGYMPKSAESIKFHYQPSEIEVKVKTHNPEIKFKTHNPSINFIPGDLRIYLKQMASLQIQAIGEALDQKI
ncbi:DUF6470 family protein [Cytobacillus firmus]|uniref:DUF6470 family protein n=1 Tax=Cytobacillus firmus TaxID=1399 RepID=UPI002185E9AD|nr:DUF6470 family protein [Cytobacillus firmus]URM33453.1 DUF6470 family protein [Cytobacillus firmus]